MSPTPFGKRVYKFTKILYLQLYLLYIYLLSMCVSLTSIPCHGLHDNNFVEHFVYNVVFREMFTPSYAGRVGNLKYMISLMQPVCILLITSIMECQ